MKRPVADRWAVITHRRSGKTFAEIERVTGFSHGFVRAWAIAADDGRGADDKGRSGRPPKVTAEVRKKIVKNIKGKERRSTRVVARTTGVSRRTVARVAKSAGLRPYHKRKRPLLTEDHKKRRRNFARKFAKHDWRATMLSDEKIFPLVPAGNSKNDVVWAESVDDVPPRSQVSKSASIMVWGGITYYGKTPLKIIDGTINSASYQKILRGTMLPAAKRLFGERHWCFQQDGARPHTAKATQKWLKQNVPSFITKDEWPANSPDANGIENLWSILDDRVAARRPKTVDELKRTVKREWRALPLALIRKLIDSQPKRLREIKKAGGGHCKY
jgi:transposase